MRILQTLGSVCLLFAFLGETVLANVGTLHRTYGEVTSAGQKIGHGDELSSGMTLTTGPDSYAVLQFSDNQVIALGAESELYIQSYLFDMAKPGRNYSHLSLIRGSLRYLSGEMVKVRPEAIEIKTPVATVTVNGSDFLVVTSSLYVQVNSGQAEVGNRKGSQIIDAGETGYARSLVTTPSLVPLTQVPSTIVGQFEALMNIPISDVTTQTNKDFAKVAGTQAVSEASGNVSDNLGVVAGGIVVMGVVLSILSK